MAANFFYRREGRSLLCFPGLLLLNQNVNRDRLTRERRSWNMSRIRSKDTTPEKAVRSLLHRMGYRFRLNVKIPIELGKQEGRKSISKYACPDAGLNE